MPKRVPTLHEPDSVATQGIKAGIALSRTHDPYSDALAVEICAEIAMGKALATCAKERGIPWSTIHTWEEDHPFFGVAYARARKSCADWYADELITIADDKDIDPHHKRIMVDARKWITSKLKPATYGDKLDITTTVQAAGPTLDLSRLNTAELIEFERMLKLVTVQADDPGVRTIEAQAVR